MSHRARLNDLVKELEAEAIAQETRAAEYESEIARLKASIREIRRAVNETKKALGIPIPPSDTIRVPTHPKGPILDLATVLDVPEGKMRCPFASEGCEFITSGKGPLGMHVKYKHPNQPFPRPKAESTVS